MSVTDDCDTLSCDLQVLKGRPTVSGRPGAALEPVDFTQLGRDLAERHQMEVKESDVINAALYPKVCILLVWRKLDVGGA